MEGEGKEQGWSQEDKAFGRGERRRQEVPLSPLWVKKEVCLVKRLRESLPAHFLSA